MSNENDKNNENDVICRPTMRDIMSHERAIALLNQEIGFINNTLSRLEEKIDKLKK